MTYYDCNGLDIAARGRVPQVLVETTLTVRERVALALDDAIQALNVAADSEEWSLQSDADLNTLLQLSMLRAQIAKVARAVKGGA